jgi:hypothetical protein
MPGLDAILPVHSASTLMIDAVRAWARANPAEFADLAREMIESDPVTGPAPPPHRAPEVWSRIRAL